MAIVCRKRDSAISCRHKKGKSARNDLGFGHLSPAELIRKDTGDFDDARGKRGRGNRCDEEASWVDAEPIFTSAHLAKAAIPQFYVGYGKQLARFEEEAKKHSHH